MFMASKSSRKERNKGGGVATLVSKEFSSMANDINLSFGKRRNVQITCTYVMGWRIYNVYKRPASRMDEDGEALLEFMEDEVRRNGDKNLVFVGDFNMGGVDWKNPELSLRYRDFAERIEQLKLK